MKLCCILLGAFAATVTLAAPAPKSLQDDFTDFIALIPFSELKDITCSYADDPEVQLVVDYLRSDEWAGLVAEVREKETWKEFKDYLNDAGIDIELVIGLVHNLITNGFCEKTFSKRSLRNLIDDLLAALPVDEIKALFYDKLENSSDFQNFFAKISSEKSRQLVEEVIALDEFQRIAAKLTDLGFDLEKVKDFIYGLLGWN